MTVTVYEELEQGTDEWLQARCGMLTASQIGKLITPTMKVADNDTSRTLLHTLAAERITGHVEHVWPTWEMQRGTDDEPWARNAYVNHYAPVVEVGFIVRTETDHTIGYSPDGLVGDDGLIEIKSRAPKTQIQTILNGNPPAANMAQMQAGMYVTGRNWCDYISYSQGLPLFVKRVHQEPKWQDAIRQAATQFETRINELINKYQIAAKPFPMTPRHPNLDEIRIN